MLTSMSLTDREREIVALLRRDPLIGSEALAHELGTTRAAVRVTSEPANPQNSDETINSSNPPRYTRRCPSTSLSEANGSTVAMIANW